MEPTSAHPQDPRGALRACGDPLWRRRTCASIGYAFGPAPRMGLRCAQRPLAFVGPIPAPTPAGRAVLLLAAMICLSACSERTVQVVTDPSEDAIARDSGTSDADSPSPPSANGAPDADMLPRPPLSDASSAPVAMCGAVACACNDGLDNDRDGQPDGQDLECTGPFDNDEATFGTGMEGSNGRCRDCFFDGNNSVVDDGCSYHRDCLTSVGPGDGRCGCDVGAECVASCQNRTPNGCDCFGCCEVTGDAAERFTVQLTDTCSAGALSDPAQCPPCVRDDTCFNPCGPCEACPGRPLSELDPACAEGGLPYRCDNGRVCGPGRPCQNDFYCLQGCCIPVVF